ncbi:type IV pilus assembly protein FimV [Pollutimonas harenae]|uniref:FimV N-terminal domain-containing protein n=1 Tax=Pollutimonas harenae TaxID=657015 RepID=A0A853GYS1_9BURK|nr:FimV/HubP family polar landmark protein [Pollutimonas harenae]NYT85876.1 hypothetical protein [Pollutimonas harenae]TEA70932.1 hypothetical protein ERD84_09765 [Pollutimonas harenae]
MRMSRAVSLSAVLVLKPKPLAGALAAALLTCSSVYAASFGHSRLVSAPGQPFQVNVQVSQLSADDLRSFSAVPAPAAAWRQAGLTPPVDLSTMQVHLADGYTPDGKLIQIRSNQAFNKPVADILLDVRTATGQQRYQVSLLTHAGLDTVAPVTTSSQPTGSQAASQAAPAKTIRIKQGDYMFAIARRHAVPGVTVYQMMIALQRANPQAFIYENINLIKAGASLTMPGHDALTAVSKEEAYRLFQQQAQAYAQYRQRAAANTGAVVEGNGAMGVVTESAPVAASSSRESRDQLRLSGGQASSDAANDDAVATSKGIEDSQQRVSQLEDNVKNLNQALQSQGLAASSLVIDSAKGLSESIAQAGSTVGVSTDAAPDSVAANDVSGNAPEGEQGQGTGSASSGSSGASDGGVQDSTSAGGAGQDSSSGAPASSADAGDTSANSSTSDSSNTASGSTAGNSMPGSGATDGHAGADQAGSGNTGSGQAGAAATDEANGVAAGGSSGQNSVSADTQGAAQTAESISTKAEQSVSWFQEHMLGVITGLLAFIVLIIAWLLRRANAVRDTGREGNTGPITEAMVKEKLDQINLDLEQEAPNRSPPDSK